MAQTTQIVPKFSFPYVEVVVNDYTTVNTDAVTTVTDDSIKQVYAVLASKGIDGVFVKKSTKSDAVTTFGESNFKKFGQPLMQALHVLEQDNSEVWIMRVMPENAAYANTIISAYYKADTAAEKPDAHDRKFRVKLTSRSAANMLTAKMLETEAAKLDGVATKVNGVDVYKDAEGYTQKEIMYTRSAGRGTYGNLYSLRVSQNMNYEKEYGIKMYNYESINSEAGLTKDATYVGCNVTSTKYGSETATLINDVLDNVDPGVAPTDVRVNEDNISEVYDAYIAFCKALHIDLIAEYDEKVVSYAIPTEMMNGTVEVTAEYADKLAELNEIDKLIDATAESELPDLDQFDIIFGLKVGSTESLPAIFYPTLLTDDVDVESDDYDDANYTATTSLVDFSSTVGVKMENGGNGYFDTPRQVIVEGETVHWTVDQEVEECYKNAFNGTLDKKILSPRRMDITAFWDANYPYSVKQTIVDLALARNDCRAYLDCGILESLTADVVRSLITDYAFASDKLISKDIHNMYVRETSTNKKVRVTIAYFLASEYVYHITNNGMHIPFVKNNARLSGHIKDTLCPVVEEYETDLKERLYTNRFNYFECINENTFERAVQNTAQMVDTDLLEESNVTILYTLKHQIETDVQGETYNFADESVRRDFCQVEAAKYAGWVGTYLESFDITFNTTKYEFDRSILHLYLTIVFRGLQKRAIVEIDINKRTYNGSSAVIGSTTTVE